MITSPEERLILSHAYVPEHLPGYVRAISGAEPSLLSDFLCYSAKASLIFIGYPLRSAFDEKAMSDALGAAVSRFHPEQVAVIAPTIPVIRETCPQRDRGHYYRLDLSALRVHAKVRNMIRRASREVRVERTGKMGEEHVRLVAEFLDSRPVSQEIRFIYERIPAYVSAVSSVRLFSARNAAGNLVAFDVADFGGRDYAFYQFNFRSKSAHVPGASDLLLHELVGAAREEGKAFVNLGLGIHQGVVHFKEKWGGKPFLTYEYCRYAPGPPTLFDLLLRKL
jgi:hypothetical protein